MDAPVESVQSVEAPMDSAAPESAQSVEVPMVSSAPVESAQAVARDAEGSPVLELRIYLLRSDGEGSAVELARLRACGQAPPTALAPAPLIVNEAAEVGRWETPLYLAVLEGGEVRQLARLSFLEGLEDEVLVVDQDEEEEEEEEVLAVDQEEEEEEDVLAVDQEEEEEEDVLAVDQEEEEEEEEDEEWEGEGEGSLSSSQSSLEEDCSSVQIRMYPGLSCLLIVLFDCGNWKLTRVQHIKWVQDSDEAKVLKLIGLGTEKYENRNPCPKMFSHWSQPFDSWLEFQGALINKKLMFAKFNASMGDFRVLKVLGEGAVGKVYECVHMHDSNEVHYALKKMDISDDFDDIDAINGEEPREVNILSCLEDDFVVSFYQAWIADGEYKSYLSSDDEEYTMKDDLLEPRYVVIQMELCQRTLVDDMPYKDREINIEESWGIFEEITRGLQGMHRMGIIHRDLKPDNIFVGINGRIKIGDMGHACWAESGELIRTPNRGTFLYMAPELDTGHVTTKADIYSIGVIFLGLFHPFLTVSEKHKALTGLRNNMQPTDWKGDTKLLMQLTALCPSDRPSTEQILDYIAQRRKNIDSQ